MIDKRSYIIGFLANQAIHETNKDVMAFGILLHWLQLLNTSPPTTEELTEMSDFIDFCGVILKRKMK